MQSRCRLQAAVGDIVDNPKKLKFVEIDAAQAPRSLEDVDVAAVSTNYAIQVGDEVKPRATVTSLRLYVRRR